MKILLISFFDPRESDGGAEQRTHRLWKSLQKLGEVYACVIVFHKEDEGYDEDSHILKVCLERHHSLRWFAQHFGIRMLPQIMLPFHAGMARGNIFPQMKFDVVVARYVGSAAYLKAWQFGPLFIDVDDDPVEVIDTRKPFPGVINRLYSYVVRRWRDSILAHAVAGWCARKTRTLDLDVLANEAFMPSASYEPLARRENLLLIVGKLDYEPNQRGIALFLKSLWPVLHDADEGLQLAIIGKGVLPEKYSWWHSVPGIKVVGYVENLEPWYERAFATVAPVSSGGGTAIKVAESLNHGRPCLASSFARRGCEEKFFGIGLHALENVTPENALPVLAALRNVSPHELIKSAKSDFEKTSFAETVARTITPEQLLRRSSGAVHGRVRSERRNGQLFGFLFRLFSGIPHAIRGRRLPRRDH